MRIGIVFLLLILSLSVRAFPGIWSEEQLNNREDSVAYLSELLADCFRVSTSNFDSCILLGNQAHIMAQALSDTSSRIESLDMVSWAYYDLGRQDTSRTIQLQAHQLAIDLSSTDQMASTAFNLGYMDQIKGDFTSAIRFFSTSIDAFRAMPQEEIKTQKKLAKALNNLALCHYELGQDSSALAYYDQSMVIRESISDTLGVANLHHNIGGVYFRDGNYPLAARHFLQARRNYESINAKKKIGLLLVHLGDVQVSIGDEAAAEKYYQEGLKIAREFELKFELASVLSSLGHLRFSQNQYTHAIRFLGEAYFIKESLGWNCYALKDATTLMTCYTHARNSTDSATYYRKITQGLLETCPESNATVTTLVALGDFELGRGAYRAAKKQYHSALEMAERLRNLDLKVESLHSLYTYYNQLKDSDRALDYLQRYGEAKDSLLNLTKVKFTTQIEDQFQFDREKQQLVFDQQRETLVLESQKERAVIFQQIAIAGVVISILITVFIAWAYRDRKKVNQKLLHLNEELTSTNDKLKKIDEYRTRLFANINHDFRTPLTLIKGYVDQIAKNEDNYLSQTSQNGLNHLSRNVSLLSQMTNEIQNLLLLEEGKLELSWSKIHLAPMLRLVTGLFESAAAQQGKELSLEINCDEDEFIHADKLYFKKIFYNLLGNALKHTSTGDTILISVDASENQVMILLSDTGTGIEATHLPYIFDRFYQVPDQAHHQKEGFGIGLSLVRELVLLHQGTIEVQSEKGKGTTFEINLPRNLDKDASSETKLSGDPEMVELLNESDPTEIIYLAEDDKKCIMVVDDHQEIRSYITSILAGDYQVIEAANGLQALELLEKHTVDLVITDLMMPWLDGFGFLDKLSNSEQFKSIPVLVLSARTSDIDRQRVLEAGVNDFITKPFDADDLKKRIENKLKVLDHNKSNAWQVISMDKDLMSNIEKDIVRKINQLILNRIDDPNLTIEDISHEINASRSKTFNLIKNITQKTPKSYIKDIRLDYIRELIKTNKVKNATEAAKAIGMLNPTEFRKQYQKKYGVHPFG